MIRFSTYAYSNGTGVFCEKQLRKNKIFYRIKKKNFMPDDRKR